MSDPRRSLAALAAATLLMLTATSEAAADATNDTDVCQGIQGQVCLGCDRVAVCAFVDDDDQPTAIATNECPPSLPFCSGGRCVERMAADNPCDANPRPSTAFRCPRNHTGYLPDPFDCSRYHYCVQGAGWDYACNVAPNKVYQHASASCVPPTEAPCTTIACRSADELLLYAPDNSVGFRCEGAGEASVIQCPANHRLDVRGGGQGGSPSPRCVRYCPRDGRQAATNDTSRALFYECLALEDGTLSKPVLQECPPGTEFDADLERCTLLPGQDV